MLNDRYVYEVEFRSKKTDEGLSLTLKGIVFHMEADSHKDAERMAWDVAKVFLRPETHDWFELRNCQAISRLSSEPGVTK